jgi:annexin A7/11
VEADIDALYDAGEGRFVTDEITICGIIFNRSNTELRQLAARYKQKCRHSLDHAIHSEFSGHMRHALLYAIQGALDPTTRDARLLEEAMEGGAKDERLTYRIIRAYWRGGHPYIREVKLAYQDRYQHHLIRRVQSETSGHHEKLLVTILEG